MLDCTYIVYILAHIRLENLSMISGDEFSEMNFQEMNIFREKACNGGDIKSLVYWA